MWFVLVVGVVVIAGWIFLANSSGVTQGGDTGMDERLPANPYENPYDTNENNDRPFEPDTSGEASGESSSDDSDQSDCSDCSSD